MKRHLRFICILMACAILLSGQCFADDAEPAQSLLEVSWFGNYLNASAPELKIDVESSAGYIQTVAVVMYDDDFDAESENNKPEFTDYYSMDEVVIKNGEIGTVTFKITDNGTPLADGAYKLLIQGSGKHADESKVQVPVWVITPSKIPGLITNFNGANVSNIKGYIDEIKNPLQLIVGVNESTERLNAFLSIRDKDYFGRFATLNDIETVWKISEIMDCLANNSSNKTRLQGLFENNSSIMDVDVKGNDYKGNTAAIYDSIVYNNNLKKATSIGEIEKLFSQATAIAAINGANGSTISEKLAEYYDEVGISTERYNKLANSDTQIKIKIERMFLNQGFLTTDKIKETFDTAVDTYIKENNDDSGSNSGSGGSGGSGGFGGGGGGTAAIGGMSESVNATVTSPIESQKTEASFADCSTEHWAYSYIEELQESGIVSGYSDGNFYPERTVKREEFVKMAVLLCGLYDESSECSFKDMLKNEWYYTYVASAYKEGIINGLSEENFGIGTDVLRQDVAVIACRLLDKIGIETSAKEGYKVFSDADKISDYAAESISILTGMNVVNGFEDGSFRPDASLTRAEAAKILSLLKSYIKK